MPDQREYIDAGSNKYIFQPGPNGSLTRIKKKEPPTDFVPPPNNTAVMIGSTENLDPNRKQLYTLRNINGKMVYTR